MPAAGRSREVSPVFPVIPLRDAPVRAAWAKWRELQQQKGGREHQPMTEIFKSHAATFYLLMTGCFGVRRGSLA
jgi:hypothetical protein